MKDFNHKPLVDLSAIAEAKPQREYTPKEKAAIETYLKEKEGKTANKCPKCGHDLSSTK